MSGRDLLPSEMVGDGDWPGDPALPGPEELRIARILALAVSEDVATSSIRDLARRSGVDHTTLIAIMEGRSWPKLSTVSKISRALGLSLYSGQIRLGTDELASEFEAAVKPLLLRTEDLGGLTVVRVKDRVETAYLVSPTASAPQIANAVEALRGKFPPDRPPNGLGVVLSSAPSKSLLRALVRLTLHVVWRVDHRKFVDADGRTYGAERLVS